MWQVIKETYESCDITNEPIKEWSPPRLGGKVVVWMNRGQTHYFIDPVAGECLSGSKIKVHMIVYTFHVEVHAHRKVC